MEVGPAVDGERAHKLQVPQPLNGAARIKDRAAAAPLLPVKEVVRAHGCTLLLDLASMDQKR